MKLNGSPVFKACFATCSMGQHLVECRYSVTEFKRFYQRSLTVNFAKRHVNSHLSIWLWAKLRKTRKLHLSFNIYLLHNQGYVIKTFLKKKLWNCRFENKHWKNSIIIVITIVNMYYHLLYARHCSGAFILFNEYWYLTMDDLNPKELKL